MPDNSLSDYRKEVQDYLRSCEYLLASATSSDSPRLSKEERGIIAHYAVELLTALTSPATRK